MAVTATEISSDRVAPEQGEARSRAAGGRATLLILFSACCFGSIPVLTTLANNAGSPLIATLAWRYGIAALLLAVTVGLTPIVRSGRRALSLALFAGGGQALIAYVSLSALRFVPAATLTFLFYTYPAWVALIAISRGRERMSGTRALALALSLLGILVMVGSPWSGALHPVGVTLALVSALIYAVYIPAVDQLRGDLTPAVSSIFITLGAAVFLGAAALAMHTVMPPASTTAWVAIGGLALFPTVLAFIAFLRGLRALGPVRTAIVSTVEPFCSALLASWVLGQPFTLPTLGGGALIAAAVILLQRAAPAASQAAEQSAARR